MSEQPGSVQESDAAASRICGEERTQSQILDVLGQTKPRPEVPDGVREFCIGQLKLALGDITGSAKRRRRHMQGVGEWIWRGDAVAPGLGPPLYPEVGTFDGVCETLGIDPSWMADRMLYLIERQQRRPRRTRAPEIEPPCSPNGLPNARLPGQDGLRLLHRVRDQRQSAIYKQARAAENCS